MRSSVQRLAIHSVPRSGSSWLGQIINSHPDVVYKFQPLFSYRFKDALSETSTQPEIENFFNEISNANDDFLDQEKQIEMGLYPKFHKSNNFKCIAYKEVRYHNIIENLLANGGNVKVVGIVRNPISVVASWLKAPKEFRRDLGWIEADEWRYANLKNLGKVEEYNGFEKWKEATLAFEKYQISYSDKFYLIRYEDILSNTIKAIDKLFAFCGLEIQKQTLEFLSDSRSLLVDDPYSVYRSSKSEVTETTLDPRISNSIIKDLRHTRLEKYLFQ